MTPADAIGPQVAKLADDQQRPQDRIESFRTRKNTMKASYAAAQAQVKVTQSLTDVGETLKRAEDKMNSTRDKADAMDSVIERGLIDDPLDRRSRTEKEPASLRHNHAVETELAQLKAQMTGAIGSKPLAVALPAPPKS